MGTNLVLNPALAAISTNNLDFAPKKNAELQKLENKIDVIASAEEAAFAKNLGQKLLSELVIGPLGPVAEGFIKVSESGPDFVKGLPNLSDIDLAAEGGVFVRESGPEFVRGLPNISELDLVAQGKGAIDLPGSIGPGGRPGGELSAVDMFRDLFKL